MAKWLSGENKIMASVMTIRRNTENGESFIAMAKIIGGVSSADAAGSKSAIINISL